MGNDHVKDFGKTIEERLEEIGRQEGVHERLNDLVAFYHGINAIEEHSHSLGNEEGFKKSILELLQIVERIKPRVMKHVEAAQVAVYQHDYKQTQLAF